MRVLPFLTLGAVASAAPLSVVVSTEVNAWRIGRPGADMGRVGMPALSPSRMGRLCHKMQSSVSRLFAIAGLGPAIPDNAVFAMASPHAPPHIQARPAGAVSISAVPGQDTSFPIWQKAGIDRLGSDSPVPSEVNTEEGAPVARPHGHHHHHNFRPYHRHQGSFIRRIHRALITLGPWEGRAVAFVLGCGVGTLLRMFWVISILTYRLIRGTSNERGGYRTHTVQQVTLVLPEEILPNASTNPPPPEYSDDKADRAIAEPDVKA